MRHTSSPWGLVQQQRNIAPGIDFVSTASHGGYLVSQERWAEFMKVMPAYGGECAFEEDCDWAFLAVVFPDDFSDRSLYHAVCTLNNDNEYYKAGRDYLAAGSVDAHKALAAADRYRMEQAGRWRPENINPEAGGKWSAWMAPVIRAEGEAVKVIFNAHPEDRDYTHAEVRAMAPPDPTMDVESPSL